ncbi:MAG: hypothetical protein H0W65_06255 [Sphingomonas sp.]|uniref:hypothetical protein n=1 Tax=Sphingomonas sp. TaxID=28214 RepID=UPI0017FC6D42|nr:hypothetical protein [Sphingomonas sp.]MBA3667308.1 hypothetical protein [Sphingomonas sp.]
MALVSFNWPQLYFIKPAEPTVRSVGEPTDATNRERFGEPTKEGRRIIPGGPDFRAYEKAYA